MKKLPIFLVFGLALSAFGCDDEDKSDNKTAVEKYSEAVLACAANNDKVTQEDIDEFKTHVAESDYDKNFPLCVETSNKYLGCMANTGCEMLLEETFDLNDLDDDAMDALRKKSGAEKCGPSYTEERCVIEKYYKDEFAYSDYYRSCVEEYKNSHPDEELDSEDGMIKLASKTTKCLDDSHAYFKCTIKLSCDVLINFNMGKESDLGACKADLEKLQACIAKDAEEWSSNP